MRASDQIDAHDLLAHARVARSQHDCKWRDFAHLRDERQSTARAAGHGIGYGQRQGREQRRGQRRRPCRLKNIEVRVSSSVGRRAHAVPSATSFDVATVPVV